MRSTPLEKAPETFFFPFDTGLHVPDSTGTTGDSALRCCWSLKGNGTRVLMTGLSRVLLSTGAHTQLSKMKVTATWKPS